MGWQQKWLGRSNYTRSRVAWRPWRPPNPLSCKLPWLPSLPRILNLSVQSLFIPNPYAPHFAPAIPSLWLWLTFSTYSSFPASQQASLTGSKRSGGHPAHHHRPPFHRTTDIVVPSRLPIAHRIARRLPVVTISAHIDPLAPLTSAPAPTPNPRGDDVPCHYNHVNHCTEVRPSHRVYYYRRASIAYPPPVACA